jgi:hypothetical protein
MTNELKGVGESSGFCRGRAAGPDAHEQRGALRNPCKSPSFRLHSRPFVFIRGCYDPCLASTNSTL